MSNLSIYLSYKSISHNVIRENLQNYIFLKRIVNMMMSHIKAYKQNHKNLRRFNKKNIESISFISCPSQY
jgi:ribosomal protein S15P/S13E